MTQIKNYIYLVIKTKKNERYKKEVHQSQKVC
jgi:hypothetical protein